ncbi:glycosyltransferase [Lewinella cohaerens]|uniref:glycosyltransferase n=1 Tax=Lewinella cohaerens TaxID=70995 RepID=UPI00037F75AC|nr:glycosyltransferase [Lewinella cohaerens]
MQISVVIPSYNQPETVQRCIGSILEQDFGGTYEIIIADSSDKRKQDELAAFCATIPKVQLIPLEKQTFPGSARNIGIKAAQGEVIALIDSDCVAKPNWLENIWKNMEHNVILTGVIENGTEDSVYGTCSFLVEFNHFLDFSGHKVPAHAAATCNFACRKEVFDKIGYFTDDRAFEDMLFCKKFTDQGGQIFRINGIRIAHLNKTDLAGIRRNQTMLGKFSAIVRRAHGMPPQLVFKLPILAFALAKFRYLSIFSRVIRSKYWAKFLLYTPVILYLLVHWSKGFYTGAKRS